MPRREDRSAPLPHHKAFVVQFHTDTELETGRMSGRVEHVVSGRATRFDSLEALLAFIGQVLRDRRIASPEEPQTACSDTRPDGSGQRRG